MRFLVFLLLALPLSASSQTKQPMPADTTLTAAEAPKYYPAIRPFFTQLETVGNSDYNSELFGEAFENGTISENLRLRSFLSFPVLMKKQIIVSGTLTHLYQKTGVTNVENISSSYPALSHPVSNNSHDFTLSLSGIHRNQLFKKPAIFSATLSLNSRSLDAVEKIRGLVSATLILKRSPNTVITVGAASFIDPTSVLPFFPSFSYWHRFSNQWEMDFILPARLNFRHSVLKKGWLTLGTEMNGTHSFLTADNAPFSGDYENSTLDLQTGLTFEYPVHKNILVGIRGGMQNSLTARVTGLNEKRKNYVLDIGKDATWFANLTLSYTPDFRKK